MITIDGHTFDEELLTGGWVIDAGCRGFSFSKKLTELGCKVYALDIENFDNIPKGVTFEHAALSITNDPTEAYFFGNGTGNFVKGINEVPTAEVKTVQCITLNDIYRRTGPDIDLLKLDIEGSEYSILENLEPIPKQITVEFHEHAHEKLHKEKIDKVLDHLLQFYTLQMFVSEWPRYKLMDCLFIKR